MRRRTKQVHTYSTCDDDGFNVDKGPILQNRPYVSSIVDGNEDASGSGEVKAVFHAGLAHGWSVNDGEKIWNIFRDSPIKQLLVSIPQGHHEREPKEWGKLEHGWPANYEIPPITDVDT